MDDIKKRVAGLAETVAGEYGVEIYDVEIAGSLRRPLVRIYIEREGGVTLDDCERFSRAMSALLDVEDPVPSSYTLEVSSPGMDRPLKRPRDFERSVGKLARLTLSEPVDGQTFLIGRINEVQGGVITLLLGKDRVVAVQMGKIAKARLEIEIK